MPLVGLTGAMGTGKSTVLEIFQELGAVVIDADKLARRAVARGSAGLRRVKERFGPGVLTPQGDLDRPALRRIIFTDPQAKADLEAIIHPFVLAEEERLVALAKAKDPTAVIVVDIPLLFEAKAASRFDQVVVVYADRETQLRRLAERDGLRGDLAQKALESQMDIEAKKALADVVIDNRGGREQTRAQVVRLYQRLKSAGRSEGDPPPSK